MLLKTPRIDPDNLCAVSPPPVIDWLREHDRVFVTALKGSQPVTSTSPLLIHLTPRIRKARFARLLQLERHIAP
jgi:hypothetical protein